MPVNRQCFTQLPFDYESIQLTANKRSAICTPQLHAVYTSCRSPHCRRFSAFSSRTASPPRPAFPMFYGFPRQAASLRRPFPSADARQKRDECPCACLCPTVPARPHACLSENRLSQAANARLPLSGRRRQAPAAKHPSLRLDDCGLPAITTLFHPHRNIALTACRRVRRVSEPMDTSKTARRPPRSRLRRPFLPLGPPPQPGTASAQRYRFPLLSGAAPFRRSSFPAQLRRLSGPSNAAARPFSAAFCAAAECDKNPVRAYGILYRKADAKEDGAHPLFGVRAVLWRKRGEKR